MSDSPNPSIILYIKSTDPYCLQARSFLDRRGVEFMMYDVSENSLALRDMVFRSGQYDLPVLVVGQEVFVGFDRALWDQVLPNVERPRIKLGVSIATIQQSDRWPAGAYVGQVRDDSPSGRAGLQKGDIIVEMAKQPVRGASDVHGIVSELLPGEQVSLTVWRTGNTLRVMLRV